MAAADGREDKPGPGEAAGALARFGSMPTEPGRVRELRPSVTEPGRELASPLLRDPRSCGPLMTEPGRLPCSLNSSKRSLFFFLMVCAALVAEMTELPLTPWLGGPDGRSGSATATFVLPLPMRGNVEFQEKVLLCHGLAFCPNTSAPQRYVRLADMFVIFLLAVQVVPGNKGGGIRPQPSLS